MNDDQIKHMVNRFLGWKLPEHFCPDAGISFKPTFNDHLQQPTKHNPIGTNLFTAEQADAMVRYILEGVPLDAAESALATLRAKYEAAEQGMPEVPRWDISGDADRWPDSLAENGEHVKYEDFDKYRSWAVATVAGLSEDAERYRDIERLTLPGTGFHIHVDAAGPYRIVTDGLISVGHTFDEAIDTARQAPVAKSGKEGAENG